MKKMEKTLNQYIDHTLLRPEAKQEAIQKLCQEAIQYQFAAVCVLPVWTSVAYHILKNSSVKLCSVVGFPLGANTALCKAYEAEELARKNVHEIDMVINIGALKSNDYDVVRHDIESVVKAAPSAKIKVIIETCLLTDEEKKIASLIAVDAGAHFVKTSTGFSSSGATIEDVALMRSAVGQHIGVKASGGIKERQSALDMIKAGASRIGTSSGVQMMKSLGQDMLSFINK